MLKKKVLHISKYYPPYKGGLEDVCKSVVDSLSEYENKVICFNSTTKDEVSFVDGVEVVRLGIFANIFSQPLSFSFVKKLKELLMNFKPDVVHLHHPNPYASFVMSLFLDKDVKLIVHWHSDIVKQKSLRFLYSPIEKLTLKRADSIFVTSPNYLKHSISLKNFEDKCVVVPNGICETKIVQTEKGERIIKKIKEEYGGKDIVYFMGRHVPYKGIEYLIEAEQYVKSDCVFLIAGEGPLTDELKKRGQGIERIKFVGVIPDDEIYAYMKAASVFAFPSITKNEAFGVVLAEAMYLGLPSVTFTIQGSGVNWVSVKNETGLEVANRDSKAFAEAIDKLLTNKSLRNKLADNASKRIRDNFTMANIKNIVNREYGRLLED
jgi:glycosyltransferase involved in cell wall biosynthesis